MAHPHTPRKKSGMEEAKMNVVKILPTSIPLWRQAQARSFWFTLINVWFKVNCSDQRALALTLHCELTGSPMERTTHHGFHSHKIYCFIDWFQHLICYEVCLFAHAHQAFISNFILENCRVLKEWARFFLGKKWSICSFNIIFSSSALIVPNQTRYSKGSKY